MSKPIKILIVTDSAVLHSGLAATTRNIFIPLLQQYPGQFDISQLGWFHVPGKEQVPWPIYHTKVVQTPQGPQLDMNDRYGQLSFNEIVEKVKPDIVFAYSDLWTFDHILTSPLRNTFRLIVYYTIDGQPYYGELLSDGSSTWGKLLAKADEVAVLSTFGEKVLHACCPELKDTEIHVRYHALEMNRFPINSEENRQRIKNMILPPVIAKDCFLVGWIGRNQFRKQNYKLWELSHYMVHGDYIECKNCNKITIKEWNHSTRATMPSDQLTMYDVGYDYSYCWHCLSKNIVPGNPMHNFYMWFHMSKSDPGYHPDTHDRMWKVSDRSIYTSNTNGMVGLSQDEVIALMQSFDVMYYPSGGEGFGNPAFECMAAGTPILFSNYSSHAEFCKFGGLPVRVANYTPELGHSIMRSSVDTNHAVEQMLKLVRNKDLRKSLGEAGRKHADIYNTRNMAPTWHQLFTNMMKKPLPAEGSKLYTTAI